METHINDPVRNTPKFSRYKSVRRAAAAAAEQQVQNAIPDTPKPKSDTIARSMSRYRRPRTAATGTAAVDSPALPAMPAPHHIPPPINKTWHGAAGTSMKSHETSSKATESKIEYEEEELSAAEKARLREEAMRTLTMAEGPQPATARAPVPASASRDLQEKNKNGGLKPASDHPQQHMRRASWKEKLGLSRQKTSAEALRAPELKTGNIEPNGKAIVPGIDAPLSAVNAGERRVLVRYKSVSFDLPVTPTTRAKDLIYSAAACVSEHIDPRTAILVETFSSLGLERPLRRYEHVRDVLNSWATDDANALVVCPSPHESAHEKLDLKVAPSGQPVDATFYLYHSPKPGKWDKRYVTLRSDGQVVVSKKANAREAKDFNNICHISDFDIYSPSARQLSKNLKPPKKICFAVKSQQKSSMFLSTENFVHYFATNDSQIAQSWYDAVHDWRSWYLAHVVKLDEKHQESMRNQSSMSPTDLKGHQQSTDSVPYQLGSKPLLDFGRNADLDAKASDKRSIESANSPSSTRDIFLRKKKARENAPPPSAFPSNLPKVDHAYSSASDQDDDTTFLPDSLLGRTYSQRQTAQREREAREANDNDPFMSHGLLKQISLASNQSNPSAHHTMRSPHQSEGFSHSRSNSVRQKPRPLVDLTPVYQEPPQHARKGHGVRIEAGVPLVEGATGLESIPGVPDIPPATAWKRDQARPSTANESPAASVAPRRGNTIRSPQQRDFSNSSNSPFVSNGLLAQTGYGANTGVGHGVATGHRQATRPLLDMTPTSQFAEGSLLRKIERQA